jgi:DNA-binding MarR family transcriptional regulator
MSRLLLQPRCLPISRSVYGPATHRRAAQSRDRRSGVGREASLGPQSRSAPGLGYSWPSFAWLVQPLDETTCTSTCTADGPWGNAVWLPNPYAGAMAVLMLSEGAIGYVPETTDRGTAMEMHQVRYFLAVARVLNFTRAADECNVTQPSLTRAIKQLEAELGGDLFRRERPAAQLTELGQRMHPLLKQCYEAATGARELASSFKSGEVGALRIALTHSVDLSLLIPHLDQIKRLFNRLARRLAAVHGKLSARRQQQPPAGDARQNRIQRSSRRAIAVAELLRACGAGEQLASRTWARRRSQP